MNSPTAQLEANLEASYERRHGVHSFTTHNKSLFSKNGGDNVSVVSQPDWGSFIDALGSVQPSADIVLSPELITLEGDIAELSSADLRSQQSKIEKRIKSVQEFSGDNPAMIVALGTAAFNGGGLKPTNSFLFMRGGKTAAQTNQQYAAGSKLDELFLLEQARGGRTVRLDLAGIVGADLIGEGKDLGEDSPRIPRAIGNFASVVLLSSGATLPREGLVAEASTPEEQLEALVGRLFQSRPQVNELIIADRVSGPSAGEAEGPLNAHFVRPEA